MACVVWWVNKILPEAKLPVEADGIFFPTLLIDFLFCFGMTIALAEPIYDGILFVFKYSWGDLF